MIPHKIHFIWLGSPLPEKYQPFICSWQKHHLNWEIKIWTDLDVASFPFRSRSLFFQALNYGLKSDILRYEILYQFGGIYADVDFLCLKNFEPLLNHSFFVGKSGVNETEICNALIGSVPHHPFLEKLIDQLTLPKRSDLSGEVFIATGPIYLSEMVYKNLPNTRLGIKLFDKDYFCSLPHLFSRSVNPPWSDFVTENSFAVHFWTYSWYHPSLPQKIRKFFLAFIPSSLKKALKRAIFSR